VGEQNQFINFKKTMRIIYEAGDVVKLKDDTAVGDFQDCRVILLHTHGEGSAWKVKVYPTEGFAEEDSIGIVDERWFIPDFSQIKR
jgi:hypothetical protein